MPKNALPLSHHEGLGDTLEAALSSIGITAKDDCGCAERKRFLNGIIPYKLLSKARCFTPEEFEAWGEFKATLSIQIAREKAQWVSQLYSDVFGVPLFQVCATCSPKPIINMIEKLDKIYESYVKRA